MQFGKKAEAEIKYHKYLNNHYVGELNAKNDRHGRGISIFDHGVIYIGYK